MSAADSAVLAQNLANYATEWSASEYTREADLRPNERALVSEFFPPPPASVLDIGCGAGRTTIGLSNAGYTPVAIDLSMPLLTLARARYPQLDFREMDATALAFADRSFDAALFSYNGIDCICPVGAREQCLREIFRTLKPGAPLIFSSHNVLGAMFSGGYFYLTGYLNALRMLALQRGNPRVREWYFVYIDAGGPQILYSAPPQRTIDQLARAGFDLLDVRGAAGEKAARRVRWREQHVHFVARRPAQ